MLFMAHRQTDHTLSREELGAWDVKNGNLALVVLVVVLAVILALELSGLLDRWVEDWVFQDGPEH